MDHAERPRHADQRSEIDEDMFDRFVGVERTVNEQAVHANRMASADSDRRRDDEKRERVPAEGRWAKT
ncbi:hypothetical protein D3C72_2533190 [compost metagenome]